MGERLRALSNELSSAVTAVTPSLVRIRGARRPATATIWRADGIAVTAAHILGPRDEGEVEVGGETVAAKVIGRARGTDLALLQLDSKDAVVPARRDEDSALQVGELVISVGHAGPAPSASLGMISTIGEGWRTRRGGRIDAFIDVDGVLGAGASGGPLLDADGALIGLNTHGLLRGGTTLPAKTVDRVVEALLERGTAVPGYLGVGVQPVRLDEERAKAAKQAGGLLVTTMVDEGPGASGGIRVGDVLIGLSGDPLLSVADLFESLAGRGDTDVELVLSRGDDVRTLTVKAGVRTRRGR